MKNSEIEYWVPIRGDDDKWLGLYEISSSGRVRSLDRVVPTKGVSTRLFKGQLLTPVLHPNGYMVTGLCRNGKVTSRLTHRLVALSFHGDPPTVDHEAAHLDGDKQNPRLSNVAWKTRLENAADRVLHGKNNEGDQNSNSRIEASDVMRIVKRVNETGSQKNTADEFGVPYPTVNHIMQGRTWSKLTGIVHKPKHVTVTWGLIEEMGQMKLEGKSLNVIAATLGVGRATVFRNYKKSSCWQTATVTMDGGFSTVSGALDYV